MIKPVKSLLLSLMLATGAHAGTVYEYFPDEIRPQETYVFYSHGFIVEGDNPTPVSPRWGTYEFPTIKQALSDDSYNLIAYHRAKGTDPRLYARKLSMDIKALVAAGVPYENIYLVGFSRGGAITGLTSHLVASDKLNAIILAGCGGFLRNNPEVDLHGRVYSVYETTDGVGSCQYVIDRSPGVTAFTELAITTGKGHGAFYTPIETWLTPVKHWIKSGR